MASVSMSMSLPAITTQNKLTQSSVSQSFFNPRPLNGSNKLNRSRGVQVKASFKETAVTGLTAAALTASMMVPDVAEAATSNALTPSLQNFLLSIGAGGVVLIAIFGAVIGVSNFDPVKRA